MSGALLVAEWHSRHVFVLSVAKKWHRYIWHWWNRISYTFFSSSSTICFFFVYFKMLKDCPARISAKIGYDKGVPDVRS